MCAICEKLVTFQIRTLSCQVFVRIVKEFNVWGYLVLILGGT